MKRALRLRNPFHALPEPADAGFFMHTPGADLSHHPAAGHTLERDPDGELVYPAWKEDADDYEDYELSEVSRYLCKMITVQAMAITLPCSS